jgi:hypothetical protein
VEALTNAIGLWALCLGRLWSMSLTARYSSYS